ncbi:MAG: response regulator transcription factor [Anaerolineales bacterium]|nr:response regulator transcription factor [Anaerolineales bacterium]
MTELLLIDDDEGLTELLGTYFEKQGYSVRIARNGGEGLRAMFTHHPALVVLDVTMPLRDGWEILSRIREMSDLPVIMLTARDEEPNVLRGFSLGADDYVTKPFSFAQLEARIKAVLARSGRNEDQPEVLRIGEMRVDLRTRQVQRGETQIQLTPTEFRLLVTLMHHAGEVVSPDELVKEVWGPQYKEEVGYVRRYIWHLRQKIEPDAENPRFVHNERGFGYRFQELEEQKVSSGDTKDG